MEVATRLVNFIFSTFSTLSNATQTKLLETHGYSRGFALFLFLRPAYNQLDRMEDHIIWATEDEVEKWRKTFISECNMSAIAGTILAQVALTSFSLPNLSQAHWTARAAFLLSLVSGCLAVFYASLLQRTLGNIRTPQLVKEWWRGSTPSTSITLLDSTVRREVLEFWSNRSDFDKRPVWLLQQDLDFIRHGLDDVRFDDAATIGVRRREGREENLKLQSSVAAAILMSSPSMMINFAVGAFLAGIGIYFGFVWKHDLDPISSRTDSRSVFICFLLSVVFCYSFYGFPFLSKLWEDNKKSDNSWLRIKGIMDRIAEVTDEIHLMSSRDVLEQDQLKELLQYTRVLAMAVRSQDYRSCLEAERATQSVDRLLKEWGRKEKRGEEGGERGGEEREVGSGVVGKEEPEGKREIEAGEKLK